MNQPLADIYKQDRLAGHFYRTQHTTEFRYATSYLSESNPPLASTLPLSEAPLSYQAGALPPFFTGLLPEGRRLTTLRSSLKVSRDDELSLLLAVGSDTVGDVRVIKHGGTLPPDKDLEARDIDPDNFKHISFKELLSDQVYRDPASLPGVQEKVSGKMLTFPLRQGNDLYLLKLTPPEYPLLVENEAFFLKGAEGLKGRNGVVKSQLVFDGDGVSGLLVKRFDRGISPDGKIARYAVEDACQLLNLYPADKYDVSALEVSRAITGLVQQPVLAAQELLRQFLYAWLTGNGDLHAKNLSVITAGGKTRLSPIYDVPSTAPYGDQSMALKILGKKRGLSARIFIEFGEQLGVRAPATTRLIRNTLADTEGLVEKAAELPFDSSRRKALVKVLKNRRLSLIQG